MFHNPIFRVKRQAVNNSATVDSPSESRPADAITKLTARLRR